MSTPMDFDVAVVGAGPVGLAFAGWLAQAWGEQAHRIAVFDAKSLKDTQQDPRILALSDATRIRLSSLAFPTQANPIHHIHVSEQGRFGQVRMRAQEMDARALGWTVRYGQLIDCLEQAVAARGVHIFRGTPVAWGHRSAQDSLEILELADGREIQTLLRVDAEGGLYGEAGDRDRVVDYNQWAIVSEVEAHVDSALLEGQNTLAFERFTPEGPVALLPLSTDQTRYSLVWCASKALTDQRLALDDRTFFEQLRKQFGRRVNVLSSTDRKCFPLGMNWREHLVQGRRVAIGNAAQILHPVAGQGLNLGLRDAAALCRLLNAEVLSSEAQLAEQLTAYEASRSADRNAVVRMTDLMVRGFSNTHPLVGAGRQTAINIMEYAPLLRKQFADFMMFGLSGS